MAALVFVTQPLVEQHRSYAGQHEPSIGQISLPNRVPVTNSNFGGSTDEGIDADELEGRKRKGGSSVQTFRTDISVRVLPTDQVDELSAELYSLAPTRDPEQRPVTQRRTQQTVGVPSTPPEIT
ncbi:hypothetical protein U1Q18_011419 [Sarracenia purpurea var. burkii]